MAVNNEFEGIAPIPGNLSEAPAPSNAKEGTVRLCYVTSPRELMTEGVGYDSRIMPTLEALQNAIMEGKTQIRRIEIAAVFVDDNGCEFRSTTDGGEKNTPSRTFTYLKNFCESNGITFHVEPSIGWRRLKKGTPEKEQGKVGYETRMLEFMRTNSIDLILSDSYTVLFNSVMLDAKTGYRGLILNMHPGIASEVPGLTPTHDAFVRSKYFAESSEAITRLAGDATLMVRRNGHDESIKRIFGKLGREVVMDDEHVYLPAGAQNIARAATGATLHEVDELIDHGPTWIYSSGTPIRKGDNEHALRMRNYGTKNNTTVRGLALFVGSEKGMERIAENRMRNCAFNGEKLPHRMQPVQTINSNTTPRGLPKIKR